MVSQFRQQHSELVALAEAILTAAGERRAADLSQLRLTFARAVIDHCREEGAAVRAGIAAGTLNAQVAARHDRIVMAWRADVALCNSLWPGNRVIAQPDDFVRHFRPLVDGLRAEVELEDVEILSVLERKSGAA